MTIDQIDRFGRLSGDVNNHTIGCKSGVERGQRALNRCLTARFKNTVYVLGPMNIFALDFSKAFDVHTLQREIIRGLSIKDTIDKNDANAIKRIKHRCFAAVEHSCIRRVRRGQRVRTGVFPIFITPVWQAHSLNPRYGRTARCIETPAFGQRQRRKTGLCR